MIYDAQPSMYYRQHGNNAIGAQRGFKVYWSRALRFLRADAPVRSCSAKSILDVYGAELSQNDANYRYLDMVANYRTNRKLKKLFRKEKAFKTGSIRDIYLSILISMGRI